MKYLKLSPEYESSPLWVSLDGNFYTNLDIDATLFDEALKAQITDWARSFDSTLNQDYPPESGFSTEQEEKEFEFAGLEIWKNISLNYLREYNEVILYSYKLTKLYKNITEYEVDLKEAFRLK